MSGPGPAAVVANASFDGQWRVSVGHFDRETAVRRLDDASYAAAVTPHWIIGANANGGYVLSPVVRALQAATAQPDPLSVTAHYLRPLQPRDGQEARIETALVKGGRSTSVARATLSHDGRDRLTVLGAFGDLSRSVTGARTAISVRAPSIPPPDECAPRSGQQQGVELALGGRLDVRIHPDPSADDDSGEALMQGWVRFRDGTEPSTTALPLFADAFPPALFRRLGAVGWVPTIELTVHVRRRPAPGWIQARFECDDLHDGRMVETGTLWDSTGAVVARSRQLGLLLVDAT